jgi:hypothetical protein
MILGTDTGLSVICESLAILRICSTVPSEISCCVVFLFEQCHQRSSLLGLPADATASGLFAGVDDTFTLERKAVWIAPVMKRHNRMGLLSDCTLTKPGDRSSCFLHDSDNDGLWTSLNVAGETFRYAVQKTPEAKASAWRHFEGMVSSQAICCCS